MSPEIQAKLRALSRFQNPMAAINREPILEQNMTSMGKIPNKSIPQYISADGQFQVPIDEEYDQNAANAMGEVRDWRGHGSDLYKTPSHITASKESIYSSDKKPLGQWKALQSSLPSGESWEFLPSPEQIQKFTPEEYARYFKQNESGPGGAIVKLK